MSKRILIIKLAAIGDVLRTTPLLFGLKRTYPQSHITWVVDKEAFPLLENNPYIDRLLTFDFSSLLPLEVETFDLLIGLEKERRGAALASKVRAHEKKGIGLGPEGNILPLNRASDYFYILGLSDELKFRENRKTYPELIFEAVELRYEKDEYLPVLSPEDLAFVKRFAQETGLTRNETVIGLNAGAGQVFANKAWTLEGLLNLIEGLGKETNARLLLLGESSEKERSRKIKEVAKGLIVDKGCDNSLGQFAALISLCDLVVTGDTTALHLAIALKKKVVALFGPTCAQEIELYGLGEKIVSSLPCAPCYRRSCSASPNCMEAIAATEVMEKIRGMLPPNLPDKSGRNRMSSSSRSHFHLLIGFLVSAAAIYLSLARINFSALWRSLQSANYFLLLPALAGQFFCFVLKGTGWRYLLIPAKKGISVTSATSVSLIGLMVNDLFPAKLGELARAYLMGERENLSKTLCLSTVLVEHLLNILVLLVFLLILLPSASLPTWLRISGTLIGFTALGILVALFFVMRREGKFLGWASRLLIRLPDRMRVGIQPILNNLTEGLRVITSRYILYAFAALFLMWSMVSLVAYLVLAAFGLSLPIQAPVMVTIFTAFGKIIPSSPGSLGTFHFLAMVVLMGLHVSKEAALGYAIVLHAVSFLMEVSLGIAALLVGNLRLGKITRRIEEPS